MISTLRRRNRRMTAVRRKGLACMVLLLFACASPQSPPSIQLPRPESGLHQSSDASSPDAERVVGYAAMAAGVVALTIFAIGFYKLARMLSH
jgi:hypothetical protein